MYVQQRQVEIGWLEINMEHQVCRLIHLFSEAHAREKKTVYLEMCFSKELLRK